MIMYQVEGPRKKRIKRGKIFILLVAILAVILAIFAGIKSAERHIGIAKAEENKNGEQYSENVQNEENANNENNTNNNNNANNENQIVVVTGNNEENNNTNSEVVKNETTPSNQNTEKPNNNQSTINTQIGKVLTDEQFSALSNIYSSKTKRVFLTFDDGPSSSVTPTILDTLKQYNIKASFFVLGTMAKSNPDLLKREKQEGHYIANHGYSHVYKNIYATETGALEEYLKTEKIIQNALGDSTYQSGIFRFPGGSSGGYYDSIKKKAKKIFKQNNIAYLDWNALTNDSAGATTEDAMMKSLKSTSGNYNSLVVLMHDAPNKKTTAKVLPKVIEYYKSKGYIFLSLGDII